MRLTVVIPCFNEKNTIRAIVDAVIAAPPGDKEIIVVDDCSTAPLRSAVLRTPFPPRHYSGKDWR